MLSFGMFMLLLLLIAAASLMSFWERGVGGWVGGWEGSLCLSVDGWMGRGEGFLLLLLLVLVLLVLTCGVALGLSRGFC